MTVPGSPASCLDQLDLQRWLDGDDTLAEAVAITSHVRGCDACRERVAGMERDRALVARLLDEEDSAAAEDSFETLARVRARLDTRGQKSHRAIAPAPDAAVGGRVAPRWRLVPAGLLLASLVLATVTLLEQRPLEASADWLLSTWQVQERAWRTEPGKVRVEVYDADNWAPGRQSERSRQATWFSTVPGAEVSITRVTRPTGELRSAMWTRTDGSSGRFSVRRAAAGSREPGGPTLTLDPPTAALEAQLPTLSPADAEALRLWLRLREWRIRPAEQAAGQAAYLSGQVSSYTTGLGVLIEPPVVRGDRDAYRLSFVVTPHQQHEPGTVLRVVDTFARGSLMLEQRVARTSAADGRLLEQTTLRLVTRRDAEVSEVEALMQELGAPPAHWRVVRRDAVQILPEARYMLRVLGREGGQSPTN